MYVSVHVCVSVSVLLSFLFLSQALPGHDILHMYNPAQSSAEFYTIEFCKKFA